MPGRWWDYYQEDQESHGHPSGDGTEVQVSPHTESDEGSKETQLDPPGSEQSEDHLRCSFLGRWSTAG
jgi:hypothetical protein